MSIPLYMSTSTLKLEVLASLEEFQEISKRTDVVILLYYPSMRFILITTLIEVCKFMHIFNKPAQV